MSKKKNLKPINFAPDADVTPKAARKGSKTDIILKLLSREKGATLRQVASAISKVGAEVTPEYARTWIAPSYLARKGYGVKSDLNDKGTDFVMHLVTKTDKVDTARSDVEK